MRTTIGLLFALLLTAVPGRAESVQILLDSPTLTAGPGDTVTFSGILVNDTAFVIDLNSIDITLNGMFTVDETPFFLGPFSIDAPPGVTQTDDFQLFSVSVDTPYTDLPGIQTGTVTILGNVETDGTPDMSVLDPLGSATFNVDVTNSASAPEPATFAMMLAALAGAGAIRFRPKPKFGSGDSPKA
jgi:hypothetical protein